MKHIILFGLLAGMGISAVNAQEILPPREVKYIQTPMVHDPVMAKEGDTYYLFSTGWNVSVMSTKDLKNWSVEKDVFPSAPQWAVDKIKGYKGHTWAPDILFHNGVYHLFYSCSTFGKNTSAIGHAYRSKLAADKGEPWTDTGEVIASQEGVSDYNAIDPNVVIDENGKPWMTFGSFWGGIQLVRLTEDLSSLAVPEERHTICTRLYADSLSSVPPQQVNAVEAPFIFRHGDYYYLFVSYDFCCRGLKSDYKVVVGRSARVTGPYVDREGRELTKGGGSLVVGGNEDFVAIGHSAAYHLDGKDYFMAHGYSRSKDGASLLFLREMTWDADGWPVVDASK